MAKICKLNPYTKKQIIKWDTSFSTDAHLQQIYWRLSCDSLESYLKFVEAFHSGLPLNEAFVYCLKNSDGEVLAFTCFALYPQLKKGEYKMYIQSIATNPKFAGKGCAYTLLREILYNPEKYMGLAPVDVSAIVDKDNLASLKLFKKFADFNKMDYDDRVLLTARYTEIWRNIKRTQPSTLKQL